MWNNKFRKYFFVLFIIVLNSCSVFQSTKNETENYDRFPKNILYTFYRGSEPPFRDGALDSLVKFADTLQGDPRFKSRVDRIVMERKYVDDFIRAYDGDSTALVRLEQACSSDNLDESEFVVITVGKIDRQRTIKKLEQLIQWEDNGYRKDAFLRMLRQQKYFYEDEHRPLRISNHQKQVDSVSDSEIETVLAKGSQNDFDNLSVVLEAAMKRGNVDYYRRSRALILSVFDSLLSAHELTAKIYANILLLPASGDTINDSTAVKEIFNGILNRSVYSSPYFQEYLDREGKKYQQFQADTMFFYQNEDVVVPPSFSYLIPLSKSDRQIIAASYLELVRIANRNGSETYNFFHITAYNGFASVGITTGGIHPIWTDYLGGGNYNWYTLRKVKGRWTIIGRRGYSVS